MITKASLVARRSRSRARISSFVKRISQEPVCERRFTRYASRQVALLSLTLSLSLLPGVSACDAQQATGFAERVIEHKLANGLTVLMVERHQTPIVSIN